jgi:hypothetical protein
MTEKLEFESKGQKPPQGYNNPPGGSIKAFSGQPLP